MYFREAPNNASLNYDMVSQNFYNYGSTFAPFCITLDSTSYNQNSIINGVLSQTRSFDVYDFDVGYSLSLSRSGLDDWVLDPKYPERQTRVNGSTIFFT
jgi:hypothetical protein